MAIATPVNVDALDSRAPVGRFDLARDEVGATPALDLPFVERHFGRDILRRAKAEGLRRYGLQWDAAVKIQASLRRRAAVLFVRRAAAEAEASAVLKIGDAIGIWVHRRRRVLLVAERAAALNSLQQDAAVKIQSSFRRRAAILLVGGAVMYGLQWNSAVKIQASLRRRAAILFVRRAAAEAEASALLKIGDTIGIWVRRRRRVLLVAERAAAPNGLQCDAAVKIQASFRRRAAILLTAERAEALTSLQRDAAVKIQALFRCRAVLVRRAAAEAEAAALLKIGHAICRRRGGQSRRRGGQNLQAQAIYLAADRALHDAVPVQPCRGPCVRFSTSVVVPGQQRATRSPRVRRHNRPANRRLHYSSAWLKWSKESVRAGRRKTGERSRQSRRDWEAEQKWRRTEDVALRKIGEAIGAWICRRRTAVLAAERVAALGAAAPSSDRIDPLLEQVAITVPILSVLPLSGNAVIRHLRDKLEEIGTRFLPCVDFLVHCQREVQQGLELAQRGQLTPSQFVAATVTTLPDQFEQRSAGRMPLCHLEAALAGLVGLVEDAKAAVPHGCEGVEDAFLGGVLENESYGLRRWLCRHGGARDACDILEEVLRQIKRLKKDGMATRRMARQLRRMTGPVLECLHEGVPLAYQERLDSHPYLPFFHRLEACLGQMSVYDPEDDGAICLDGSEDEDGEDRAIEAVASRAVAEREAAMTIQALLRRHAAILFVFRRKRATALDTAVIAGCVTIRPRRKRAAALDDVVALRAAAERDSAVTIQALLRRRAAVLFVCRRKRDAALDTAVVAGGVSLRPRRKRAAAMVDAIVAGRVTTRPRRKRTTALEDAVVAGRVATRRTRMLHR